MIEAFLDKTLFCIDKRRALLYKKGQAALPKIKDGVSFDVFISKLSSKMKASKLEAENTFWDLYENGYFGITADFKIYKNGKTCLQTNLLD
jgi:hypothetical protein